MRQPAPIPRPDGTIEQMKLVRQCRPDIVDHIEQADLRCLRHRIESRIELYEIKVELVELHVPESFRLFLADANRRHRLKMRGAELLVRLLRTDAL